MLRIYEQLAPSGATVTESATLTETSGTAREVDILIEHVVADARIVVAVECRDHARVSDIEWIDQLIGKYRDLDVNKVIAVASRGFSAAATEKAAGARIDCRSLEAALDSDWPAELDRIGLGLLTLVLTPRDVGLRTEPPWAEDAPPARVTFADGRVLGMQQFCEFAATALRPRIADYFFKEVARLGRPVGELSGQLDQTYEVVAEGVTVESASGATYRLLSASFRITTTSRLEPVSVERQRFGSAAITTGVLSVPEEGGAFKIVAVQAMGKPIAKPIVSPILAPRSGPKSSG